MLFHRNVILSLISLLAPLCVWSQNENVSLNDTAQSTQLEDVIIFSQKSNVSTTPKPLATIEQYLEDAHQINMIRRGGYAWEPVIDGMATERSVITIDGMRIYAACTDKMDPITSYVEISNLSKANIHAPQSSASGASIGGSLDLERKKSTFGATKINGTGLLGIELNNKHKVVGASTSYTSPRWFMDIDFTFRDAENYKAGNGQEVMYSQFTKYNTSAIAGFKINNKQHVEASLIYDHAVNVGYPALPMDVSKAQAVIGSVEYINRPPSIRIHEWKTKIYYNSVTHIMDDSKRPLVPIRMDMPGWSNTVGLYSTLHGKMSNHHWEATMSGHSNKSFAEMTMFANDPDEKDMYMITWPGVSTNYLDIFLKDDFHIGNDWESTITAGIAMHNNKIDNDFGYESLRIFYPDLAKSNTRLLKRLHISVEKSKNSWSFTSGVSYGERAPSVSEGYGFYLFNSFDRYDYICNPEMKNEQSYSINAAVSFKHKNFSSKLSATHFYIRDYILGRHDKSLSAMTIGAMGVKSYEQLHYAHIFNIAYDLKYQFHNKFLWSAAISYRKGSGDKVDHLPMMQPLSYFSEIAFNHKTSSISLSLHGASKHTKYNPDFGEQPLPAYCIFNAHLSNRFLIQNQSILLKIGVENIFNNYYTTFADWNRIPRLGRNVYINILYHF